jgi:hypothetical protein
MEAQILQRTRLTRAEAATMWIKIRETITIKLRNIIADHSKIHSNATTGQHDCFVLISLKKISYATLATRVMADPKGSVRARAI